MNILDFEFDIKIFSLAVTLKFGINFVSVVFLLVSSVENDVLLIAMAPERPINNSYSIVVSTNSCFYL